MIQAKFIFSSASILINHQLFGKNKDRLTSAIKYLAEVCLLIQALENSRFLKGAHSTYAIATPTQLRNNQISSEALSQLQLTIADCEKLWQESTLPSAETATKTDKLGIDHIKKYLHDYISIIHRLRIGTDPVAQEMLKPRLYF